MQGVESLAVLAVYRSVGGCFFELFAGRVASKNIALQIVRRSVHTVVVMAS